MKTSPRWMDYKEIESAAKHAESAAASVRAVEVLMKDDNRPKVYVLNAGALKEGLGRLRSFAASAQRALGKPDPISGPENPTNAPKRSKKTEGNVKGRRA